MDTSWTENLIPNIGYIYLSIKHLNVYNYIFLKATFGSLKATSLFDVWNCKTVFIGNGNISVKALSFILFFIPSQFQAIFGNAVLFEQMFLAEN